MKKKIDSFRINRPISSALVFVLVGFFVVISAWEIPAQVRRRPVVPQRQNPSPNAAAPVNKEKINMNDPLADCKKLIEQNLYKDALEILQPWTLRADADPQKVAEALGRVQICLFQLNRGAEAEDYLEKVISVHEKSWRVLQAAAQAYFNLPHYGSMIDGKFVRDVHSGDQFRNSWDRDRVTGLQLMQKAAELVKNEPNKKDVGQFYLNYAKLWMSNQNGLDAWKLQLLTDLSQSTDYDGVGDEMWGDSFVGGRPNQPKAAVDTEGNPIYYNSPKTFEDAKNDGERWRWCLDQAAEMNNTLLPETLFQRAEFVSTQFGVETMQEYSSFFQRRAEQSMDRTKAESGTWELHTLKDNETIAKLATGVKRFVLPDDQNPILLYRKILDIGTAEDKQGALTDLAQIYENRRQFPQAAKYWKQLLDEFPLANAGMRESWKNSYEQIVKNWGRFEPRSSQVAGKGAELQYLFRNGKSVILTAQEIRVAQLLEDIKTYIKSKPSQLDYQKISGVEQIGFRLVTQPTENAKYLGKEIARWTVPLQPAQNHFDRRTTITVPVQTAGAYLVKAQMEDGNTEFIVVWLNDTAIVRKPLENAHFYYIADAESGAPVADANIEFFGYNVRARQQAGNRLDYDIKEIQEKTDASGQLIVKSDLISNRLNWLITAKTANGRFAYLGFSNIWYSRRHDQNYNQAKAFFISDRPVYRPKDKVQYKFWIGTAKYDAPEQTSEFAGKEVLVEIRSPRGERIEQKVFKLDPFGGLVGELALKEDAMLGVYNFSVSSFVYLNRIEPLDDKAENYRIQQNYGHGTLRVEEYKKPEFEVIVDAPKEPVALGESITAKIQAKYYFGAPVVNATVKYKVLREKHNSTWYPIRPWDWFYGKGYWWFAYDYDWFPGWNRWGCVRPISPWIGRGYSGPPEVVLEQEVPIGLDGTVEVKFDTAFTKELFPNDDQKYTITAEVVDQSRRTIVGSGTVLLAQTPFKVYTWVNRGYYEPNSQINANFQARRVDGKPVAGDATVKVYKITYSGEQNKPSETEVHSATLKLNETGSGNLSLNAGEQGQYRVSCVVKDAAGHEQEGGYIFSVYGPNQAGTQSFAFNQLELVPNKAEYAPNENVELRINSNRTNATVLLFVKPIDGVYTVPQLVKLQGKSASVKIPVLQKDMPNFYLEVVAVSDGKVLTETKEIVVPPEKRIINVEVEPSSDSYKPGENAKAKLKITDMNGKPVEGQVVVSIYDKSVEYISGGSNVGDIKEFFWKWRRDHNPQTVSSLGRTFHNMSPPDKPRFRYIGIFGASIADEDGRMSNVAGLLLGGERALGAPAPMSMGGMGGGMPMMSKMAAPSGDLETTGVDYFAADMGEDAMIQEVTATAIDFTATEGGESSLVEATVRKEFADTALWVGALNADKDGIAEVDLKMPENLTTWKINVWAMGLGTKVGYASTEVLTRKDLIIRMQTPRFLVQKDQVYLTANVHNYLKSDKNVQVSLELEGPTLEPSIFDGKVMDLVRNVKVPANGEARVDWVVDAKVAGNAIIRMKALTNEESDAVQNTIPVYVHGMLKQEAQSGYLKPEETKATLEVRVPAERRPEETKLTVRFSPTLAGAMIDALPYLTSYPYGCTEQTLNRFLPTVITQKTLIDMNVDLDALRKAHANLNAQELGDPQKRAEQWKKDKKGLPGDENAKNPVFSREEVRKMTDEGVRRLTEMQLSNGGWGWFSGYGEYASANLTAQVVRGLVLAQQCDVQVDQNVIDRGIQWLRDYQVEQVQRIKNGKLSEEQRKNLRWKSQADELDAIVFMVLMECDPKSFEKTPTFAEMKDFLYQDRTKISLYAVAMLGIALEKQGDKIKAEMCKQILDQYLVEDDENQTAYLNFGKGNYTWRWWCWFDDEFETQATYLKLITRLNSRNTVSPKLVKYLLNNRKHATYWNSTRDTAICVETFAEYLRATDEDNPNLEVEILVDGVVKKTEKITPENMFLIDNTLVLSGDELSDGTHKIEIRKKGRGPLYFNTYLQNFTMEDPITKTGLEVKIERRYYLLKRQESATQDIAGGRGQAVAINVEKYDRVPLKDLESVKSGEKVEIELIVESKNDYESLMLEDFKPAGFEPVELRSGYTDNALNAYVEYRDNRVTFFVYRLARGKHSVSYQLRAEQPGSFSALPAKIEAMYAPELKGNSDEFKVRVND